MNTAAHRIANRVTTARARALLLVSLLLPVTAVLAEAQQPVPVRLLVSQTTAALPFLLMAKEQTVPGVDLRVDFFASHAQALALLLRGDTDLLLSGTSQGWENRLDGSPIVMIDTGVWAISSLVGKDSSITGFADLRGKRIAMPFPGSPLDFQSRTLLAFEKIDPDRDVTISFSPFAQSVQMLLAGRLDAAALPEPLATTVVKKNGLLRLVEYSQAWARFTGGDRESPQVSLFASEGYAQDHAAIIASVVAAWDEASRKVTAGPADAAAQFSAALATDPAILEEATRNTLLAVPSPAECKARVLAYYQIVSKYFPGGPRPLDQKFFFVP
ncbi:MAG: ABC transporter substrate-binding protein [Spirochaetia bacterium]|jgi:NitT/TauT family transport system substrate-binding protein